MTEKQHHFADKIIYIIDFITLFSLGWIFEGDFDKGHIRLWIRITPVKTSSFSKSFLTI